MARSGVPSLKMGGESMSESNRLDNNTSKVSGKRNSTKEKLSLSARSAVSQGAKYRGSSSRLPSTRSEVLNKKSTGEVEGVKEKVSAPAKEQRQKEFFNNLYLDAERRHYLRQESERARNPNKSNASQRALSNSQWDLRWREMVNSRERTKSSNEATRLRMAYQREMSEVQECFFHPVTVHKKLSPKDFKKFRQDLLEFKKQQNAIKEKFEQIDDLEEEMEKSVRRDFLHYNKLSTSQEQEQQCLIHYKNAYSQKISALQAERIKVIAEMKTLDSKVMRYCTQATVPKFKERYADYYDFELTGHAEAYINNDNFAINLKNAAKERAIFTPAKHTKHSNLPINEPISPTSSPTLNVRNNVSLPTNESICIEKENQEDPFEVAALQASEMEKQIQMANTQHKLIFSQMQNFFAQNINNTYSYDQVLSQQPFLAILDEFELQTLKKLSIQQQPHYAFNIVRMKMQQRLAHIQASGASVTPSHSSLISQQIDHNQHNNLKNPDYFQQFNSNNLLNNSQCIPNQSQFTPQNSMTYNPQYNQQYTPQNNTHHNTHNNDGQYPNNNNFNFNDAEIKETSTQIYGEVQKIGAGGLVVGNARGVMPAFASKIRAEQPRCAVLRNDTALKPATIKRQPSFLEKLGSFSPFSFSDSSKPSEDNEKHEDTKQQSTSTTPQQQPTPQAQPQRQLQSQRQPQRPRVDQLWGSGPGHAQAKQWAMHGPPQHQFIPTQH